MVGASVWSIRKNMSLKFGTIFLLLNRNSGYFQSSLLHSWNFSLGVLIDCRRNDKTAVIRLYENLSLTLHNRKVRYTCGVSHVYTTWELKSAVSLSRLEEHKAVIVQVGDTYCTSERIFFDISGFSARAFQEVRIMMSVDIYGVQINKEGGRVEDFELMFY